MWTLFQTFGAGLAAFLFMGGFIFVICVGVGDLAETKRDGGPGLFTGGHKLTKCKDDYLDRLEAYVNGGFHEEDHPKPVFSRDSLMPWQQERWDNLISAILAHEFGPGGKYYDPKSPTPVQSESDSGS